MSAISQAAMTVAIGSGATAAIDLWNLALRRLAGIPSLDYCLLGRWVTHLPRGVVRHRSIAAAAPRRFECVTGWVSHYGIGIALAAAFIAAMGDAWLVAPALAPAIGFGLLTVAFPFLVLQPAIGLGVASSAARDPMAARLKSLATHTVYGAGLYVCARVLAAFAVP